MITYQIIKKGIDPNVKYYVKVMNPANGLSYAKGSYFRTQEGAMIFLQKLKIQNEDFTRDNLETVVYTETP